MPVLLVLIALGIVILGPIFTILSVNHLFDAGWNVDLATYAAVVWLSLVIGSLISLAGNKG